MLIARRIGLAQPLVIIAGLAIALSPLTQFLYGVGQIDHHFAEHIFVLATIAAGLRWFSRPNDTRAAIMLGIVLGVAPAIHNGLFVLQVPVLATLFAMWTQGTRMPMRTTLQFAAALVLATLAVLIPSLPFRLGLFEFYTLSWFHLYIAAGSATVAALALAHLPPSKRNFAAARRHRTGAAAAAGAPDPDRSRVPRRNDRAAGHDRRDAPTAAHGLLHGRQVRAHRDVLRHWCGSCRSRSCIARGRDGGSVRRRACSSGSAACSASRCWSRSCGCTTSARSRCTCRGCSSRSTA